MMKKRRVPARRDKPPVVTRATPATFKKPFSDRTCSVRSMSDAKLAPSNPDAMSSRLLRALLLTPVRTGIHFLALVAVILIWCHVAQNYVTFFEARELWIPPLTEGVVRGSMLFNKFWYLAFLAWLFLDTPLLFCLELLPARYRWLPRVWFSGFLFLALAVIMWVAFCLHAPLHKPPRAQGRPNPRDTSTFCIYQKSIS